MGIVKGEKEDGKSHVGQTVVLQRGGDTITLCRGAVWRKRVITVDQTNVDGWLSGAGHREEPIKSPLRMWSLQGLVMVYTQERYWGGGECLAQTLPGCRICLQVTSLPVPLQEAEVPPRGHC